MLNAIETGSTSDVPETTRHCLEFFARRPFHPLRLYCLLNSPWPPEVSLKGSFWIATQPGLRGELECSDGQVRIRTTSVWWASVPENERPQLPGAFQITPTNWHPIFGDRQQAISIHGKGHEPQDIGRCLTRCLVGDTDDVGSWDPDWARLSDPFPLLCGAGLQTSNSPDGH